MFFVANCHFVHANYTEKTNCRTLGGNSTFANMATISLFWQTFKTPSSFNCQWLFCFITWWRCWRVQNPLRERSPLKVKDPLRYTFCLWNLYRRRKKNHSIYKKMKRELKNELHNACKNGRNTFKISFIILKQQQRMFLHFHFIFTNKIFWNIPQRFWKIKHFSSYIIQKKILQSGMMNGLTELRDASVSVAEVLFSEANRGTKKKIYCICNHWFKKKKKLQSYNYF